MPTADQRPAAVRATAFVRPSRWLRRPVRVVRHDALWDDGRVTFDVDLVGLLYRRAPADFEPVDRAVHETCPEVGVGAWVDDRGGVVDGPVAPTPPALVGRGGRPRRYRRPGPPADADTRRRRGLATRAIGGAAGIGAGVPLLLAAPDHQALGPVGVVCCLGGAAALTGLVTGGRRG